MEKDFKIVKPTIQVTLFSFINVILGFIVQIIVAYYFGATTDRDAYFAAIVIPTYITSIFNGSIGFIFLPRFVELHNSHSEKSINNFLSITLSALGAFTLVIIIFGVFLANVIIRMTAPGFEGEQYTLTVNLFRILLPSTFCLTIVNILSSIWQVKSNFIKPAFTLVFSNVFSLISMLLLNKTFGIKSLAIGYLFGNIVAMVFLWNSMHSYKIKFKIDFKDPMFANLFKPVIPLFVAGIIFRATSVFERMIASGLTEGSVSYLGYSAQITSILSILTSGGIAASIYPLLSKTIIENKTGEAISLLNKAIRIIFLLTIPVAFILLFWADPFIKLFFERGAFNSVATESVGKALKIMIFAFFLQSLGNVLIKIFYITGKTLSISVIGFVELIIYILLGFTLSHKFSYLGLAASLSISSLMNIVLSFIYINRNILKLDFRELFQSFIKVFGASFISFIAAYFLFKISLEFFSDLPGAIFWTSIGIVFYLVIMLVLKIEEIDKLKVMVLSYLNNLWSKKL